MENMNVHPMQCDPITGICEVPGAGSKIHQPEIGEVVDMQGLIEKQLATNQKKAIKLLYFTDPICSSCWGIDPQLRKLKKEYGHYFTIEYRMGGLLKSWDSYVGSDVNGPASVAAHWDEASKQYNMPIDGAVWLEDPLASSYPPSIAFKAAEIQDKHKAMLFLRRIKEMVFIEKKNITQWEYLKQAATETGLNLDQFEKDYNAQAKELFNEDLALARERGVRGFPTIFFLDQDDNQLKVYGSKPYEVYEQTLLKLVNGQVIKEIPNDSLEIFNQFSTSTLQEYALFYNLTLTDALAELEKLEAEKYIQKSTSRAGQIWYKNKL